MNPDTPHPKTRVVVIDDHPVVCDGLSAILNRQPDLEVCGSAATHHEALALIERVQPHVILLDISLQDCDGLDLLRTIKARHPRLAVAILSVHDESVYAARAIRAGASGYIMKGADSRRIIQSLREIAAGGFAFSPGVQRRLFWEQAQPNGPNAAIHSLTDRELSVFRLLGQGMNTEEMAAMLKISVKTVETHRMHIKSKLDIDSLNKLIECAVSWQRAQT